MAAWTATVSTTTIIFEHSLESNKAKQYNMAQSINVNIRLPVMGTLQIYVDPRDQERALNLIRRQPKILTKAYDVSAKEFADKIKRIVKRCIQTGTPPVGQGVSWPPHSPHTIKRFGAHPLFNLTGQYYRSVDTYKKKKGTWFVGVPSVLKTRPGSKKQGGTSTNGIRTLNQIAYILEVGTSSIPPRPLWKPAYQAVGGNKEFRKILIKNIKKEIRKEVGGIRKYAPL